MSKKNDLSQEQKYFGQEYLENHGEFVGSNSIVVPVRGSPHGMKIHRNFLGHKVNTGYQSIEDAKKLPYALKLKISKMVKNENKGKKHTNWSEIKRELLKRYGTTPEAFETVDKIIDQASAGKLNLAPGNERNYETLEEKSARLRGKKGRMGDATGNEDIENLQALYAKGKRLEDFKRSRIGSQEYDKVLDMMYNQVNGYNGKNRNDEKVMRELNLRLKGLRALERTKDWELSDRGHLPGGRVFNGPHSSYINDDPNLGYGVRIQTKDGPRWIPVEEPGYSNGLQGTIDRLLSNYPTAKQYLSSNENGGEVSQHFDYSTPGKARNLVNPKTPKNKPPETPISTRPETPISTKPETPISTRPDIPSNTQTNSSPVDEDQKKRESIERINKLLEEGKF